MEARRARLFPRLAGIELRVGPDFGRVVDLGQVGHIDGHHLARAATFQLIGVEAIPCPHVQAPGALELREGKKWQRMPELEPAPGHDPRRDIDGVVPLELVQARLPGDRVQRPVVCRAREGRGADCHRGWNDYLDGVGAGSAAASSTSTLGMLDLSRRTPPMLISPPRSAAPPVPTTNSM